MKKFLTLQIIFLMMSVFIPIEMYADTPSQNYSFIVYKFSQSYSEYEKSKTPDIKRSPLCPILCAISQSDGVCISGYVTDFTSYEIWDAEGVMCLASFLDENDFIDGLFSMAGEFQIRLVSEDYILIGYVSTDI